MKESDIQSDVMIALGNHPDVAWVYVTSAGSFRVRGGYVTVGFKGLSDILGQMRDGRLIALEIKKPKEKPKPEQFEFLDLVSKNGAVSGWCTCVSEAIEIIEQ